MQKAQGGAMIIKRCPTCQGSKIVLGGGCVEQKCHHCEGQGHFEMPDDEIKFLEVEHTEMFDQASKKIKGKNKKPALME